MRSSILIIYTGGTIGMQRSEQGYIPVSGHLQRQLALMPEFHRPEMPDFTIHEYTPLMDSSDMTPEDWQHIADDIKAHYDQYDGFVILHGTDTMAFTASALSFMLENLSKPVIVTGSQIPLAELRSDGQINLLNSLYVAANYPINEVSLFFNNRLYRGNRTTKINAENFNAFRSFNYPVLASAGIHIKYNNVQIHTESTQGGLQPHYLLDTNIAILKLFPGIQESVVDAILSIEGLKAVVLETYGSGNAPRKEWFLRRLHDACEQGIVIVNVTQCSAGTVEMERYETGYRLMQAGVVCGYDSTTESAVTKLMFLLGHNYSPAEVRELMNRPIAGEITIT